MKSPKPTLQKVIRHSTLNKYPTVRFSPLEWIYQYPKVVGGFNAMSVTPALQHSFEILTQVNTTRRSISA